MAKLKIAPGTIVTVARSDDDEVVTVVVLEGNVCSMPDDDARSDEQTPLTLGEQHDLAAEPRRLFNAGIVDAWIDVLRSALWYAHCENIGDDTHQDAWKTEAGTKQRARNDRDDHVADSSACGGKARIDPV